MQLRTEVPADILTIDALLKENFETDYEAKLVRSLRENSRFTLSLVACSDEGEIIGHALFTPVTLNGIDFGWQGLAPLIIKKAYRNQGIASQLIREGFDSLYELGYSACVVLGDPKFYARFGFVNGEDKGLISAYNSYPDYVSGAFQVIAFTDDAFENHAGLIEYSPEFS